MCLQATPKLSENNVNQCVDARLNGEYPLKAAAKVTFSYYHFFSREGYNIDVWFWVCLFMTWYGSDGCCSCALCAIWGRVQAKHEHSSEGTSASSQSSSLCSSDSAEEHPLLMSHFIISLLHLFLVEYDLCKFVKYPFYFSHKSIFIYIYTRNCTVLLPINGEHFLHVFRYKSVFSPVWTLKCSHSTYLHPRPLSLVSKVCNERKSMTFGLNFIQERRKQGQKDDNMHTLQSKNQDSNDYVKTKHRGTWNIKPWQLSKHTTPFCKQMKKKSAMQMNYIEPLQFPLIQSELNIQTKIFYFPIYSWFLKYNSFLDCAGGANPGMSLMSLLFGCTIWRPKNQELQQLSNE